MNTKFPLANQIFSEIKESYKNWKAKSSPYDYYSWRFVLSPIEWNVWQDIRCVGLPFYPQFPVGRYFVDFADPIKKIAIEVDSKQWHKDKEKDKKRENEIIKMGWRVFRIQSKQTYKTYYDYIPKDKEDRDYLGKDIINQRLKDFCSDCSEGILLSIMKNYYVK